MMAVGRRQRARKLAAGGLLLALLATPSAAPGAAQTGTTSPGDGGTGTNTGATGVTKPTSTQPPPTHTAPPPKPASRPRPPRRTPATPAPVAPGVPAPPTGTPQVAFFAPTHDVRVGGPKVEVQLTVSNFRLIDANTPVLPGEGHAHVYIDREPVAPGQLIPTGLPDIVHLGKPPFDARSIQLSPGRHTLVAQLADSAHTALSPPAVASVTFVASPEAFRGRGLLQPGCAEVAQGSAADVKLVFPGQGGLLQGVITSRCTFSTEGGTCQWSELSRRRVLGTYNPEAKSLSGMVSGSPERQLVSGNPQFCLQAPQAPSEPSPFSAILSGQSVSGTLGQASFVVNRDDGVTLAEDPASQTTETTTTTAEVAEAATRKKGGFPVAPVLIGIAVVAALVGFFAWRKLGIFKASSGTDEAL